MATVQQGKKKMKIVNGVLVEEEVPQTSNSFRQAPPAQPYNVYSNSTTNTTLQPRTNKQNEVQVPYAIPAVFLCLAEALFFDWITVLITFITLIILMAYFIVRQ